MGSKRHAGKAAALPATSSRATCTQHAFPHSMATHAPSRVDEGPAHTVLHLRGWLSEYPSSAMEKYPNFIPPKPQRCPDFER